MTKLIRILSIDGGGIRGILPAQILVALEKTLQTKTGNEDARIADYFDLVAGTSTGGVLACVFLCPEGETSRPRFSALEAVGLYFDHGAEIFHLPVFHRFRTAGGLSDEKYPSDGLENVLRDYLRDLRLSDLIKPCLITAYDIRRRQTVFFTQHAAKERKAKDFFLVDVARAATAAPTFFEPPKIASGAEVEYPLVDGAVFANNPSLCAYAEAHKHFAAGANEMAILSLGTGIAHQPYHWKEAKDWGAVGWVKPLFDIMMTGSSEVTDFCCRQAFEAVGKPEHYLRVNADLTHLPPGVTADMDDASEANLRGLKELATETAQKAAPDLDRFADLLIAAG